MPNNKCEKKVYRPPAWIGPASSHGVTAKYEHEGKWYCKTHHPPTIQAKEDERSRKWHEEWNAKDAAAAKGVAIHNAKQRVLRAASVIEQMVFSFPVRELRELREAVHSLKELGWRP